jgi:PAS domain S-box-containing protein
MPDTAPWLSSLPYLTPSMSEQVQSAYRQGLLQSALPVVLLDLDGRILALNRHAEELAGLREADAHGHLIRELAHADDRATVDDAIVRLRAGTTRQLILEVRAVQPDGRVRWCRPHTFRVDDEVSGRGLLVVLVEDITEERFGQRLASSLVDTHRVIAAGAALSDVGERLAAIAEDRWSGVGCSLAVLDEAGEHLVPVANGRLPQAFVEALGPIPVGPEGAVCGNAAFTSAPVAIVDLPGDPRARLFHDALERFGIVSGWGVPVVDPVGRTVGSLSLFHQHRLEPTAEDWQALDTLAAIAGVAVFVDAERRKHQEQGQGLRLDALTGMPNTVAFLESIAADCADVAPLTVAVLRLHDLAGLSSALGDDSASLVLSRLADRARSLGGVHAVALVGPLTLAVAATGSWTTREAELMRRVLCRPVEIAALTVRPDLRVGVAVKPEAQRTTAETIVRQATMALPEAGSACYDPSTAHEQVSRYALAAEVRRALRRSEFVLHYQPQYDLRTGQMVGSEALVRWQHPERGLLPPGAFLPAIELAAAGPDLALYVARRALQDGVERRQRGLTGKVAINLTAQDVRHEQLLDFLCDPDERRWDALDIELTENSLADRRCVAALDRLAAAGYSVALDDFGTGYSSLSALHSMPLAVVKVDRSFIQRLPGDLSAEALVGAVASMCSRLGVSVVAEGIETPAQAAAARRLGCRTGQGFLLSRPRPVPELDGASVPMPDDGVGALADESVGPVTTDPRVVSLARRMRQQGASVHSIAAALNRSGYLTATGSRWHARSVSRVLEDVG